MARISLLSILLFLFASSVTALFPTRLVYEFPRKGQWLENLAVRRDGSVLVSSANSSEIYLIDPKAANATAKLVFRFDADQYPLGITETTPDTFEVSVVRNLSVADISIAPNSTQLYRLAFPPCANGSISDDANVSFTAELLGLTFSNGLTTLNDHTVLAADSHQGAVWAIDTNEGTSRPVLSDPLMLPTGHNNGIDGIKIYGNTLYWTHEAASFLAKVDIDLKTGERLDGSNVTIITYSLPLPNFYDDFALDVEGKNAYLSTAGGNSVARVELSTGKQEIIAGRVNSIDIATSIATAFGRGKGQESILSVVTGGGYFLPINGNEVVGGQLVAVDLGAEF